MVMLQALSKNSDNYLLTVTGNRTDPIYYITKEKDPPTRHHLPAPNQNLTDWKWDELGV